jgi:CPA1 family monovalent cation:H+ antiporter
MDGFEYILLLLVVVLGLTPVARRFDIPLPILQVIAGMALAALPWKAPTFDPELVFLIFVPPLLYVGALLSSRRDLSRHRRPIAFLALGCVTATIVAVAVAAHAVVPGISWTAATVLGAMVSPPDAAVTLALTRRLGVPRALVTILEGETLFNDIVAFTVFRMTVAGLVAGGMSWWDLGPKLVVGAVGGVAMGLALAWVVVRIRRRLVEPRAANTLSLLTPFAAYIPAEWLHVSGVLAVVTAGLALNRVGPRVVPARTRLQAQQMWEVVLFVLEGLIFLILGTQLGAEAGRIVIVHDPTMLWQIVAVAGTVIAIRIVCLVPTAWFTGLCRRANCAVDDHAVDWRAVAVISWTGIRGGDTLVTALALPLFPQRELVQTLAYGTILATLLLQGLTLRPLVRWCGFPPDPTEASEEAKARHAVSLAGVDHLAALAQKEGLPEDVSERIRVHHHLRRHVRSGAEPQSNSVGSSILARHLLRINREVLGAERAALIALRDQGAIGEEVMRRLQREIDLEEVVMERAAD